MVTNMNQRKWRVLILTSWLVVTLLLVLFMPNMGTLVREKGQISLPESAQSEQAAKIINGMRDGKEKTYQMIAVFHSNKKLTADELTTIEKRITAIQTNQTSLGIDRIVSHLDNKTAKKQLLSSDGTTVMLQLEVLREGTITEIGDRIRPELQITGVESYLTGNALVLEDFAKATHEGVEKTEVIAIIFIVLVLLLVFRSPIVPIISLLSVGISYVVALGITAQLVQHFGFPFSNFTQVFMVVVLFGVGTDYNILLFTRFKEELSKQKSVGSAIKTTYQTAGKTVIYSGVAVFIGFAALIFAQFKIYQAASPVAIGVAVLLLVLLTLNPIFMALLGKKLFWPTKNFAGHQSSKLWGFLSKQAFYRPVIALIIVAVLTVPFMLNYSGKLNYDDLVEINDKYESKQGITLITKHFPAGLSAPTTLAIKSEQPMANPTDLKAVDELAAEIANIDGVATVYSVTRPLGERVDNLYTKEQSRQLHSGLDKANKGLSTINSGLTEAEQKLAANDVSGAENVQQLIDGTSDISKGTSKLTSAVGELTTGFSKGAAGADQLATGLGQLRAELTELNTGITEFKRIYLAFSASVGAFGEAFDAVNAVIENETDNYKQIEENLYAVMEELPESEELPEMQDALARAITGQERMSTVGEGLKAVQPKYEQSLTGLKAAEATFNELSDGLNQMETAVVKLETGAKELATGLRTGETGSIKVKDGSVAVEGGLKQLNQGQVQLQSGLGELEGQMKVLAEGMSASTAGLSKVKTGLGDAQRYIGSMSKEDDGSTFAIPKKVINSAEFQESITTYMSKDKRTMRFGIVLDVNPYSKEAMAIVETIDRKVAAANESSELENKQLVLGGKTVQNIDLQTLSQDDFTRTLIIMLIGIGLVLVFITRSAWQTLIIISSLLISYFTALGLTELVSGLLFKDAMLGWNVPFFCFIMSVALGVDYSIFLMMRYREEKSHSYEGIVAASKEMGGVIMAAAVILGGTFAALIPSGILTLMQVAIAVIICLILLSLVMIPIYITAMMGLTEKIRRLFNKNKLN